MFQRDCYRCLGHEGYAPGQHLIKDDAERIDIATIVVYAVRLLGGHILRRADHCACVGDRLSTHYGLCQPKIDEIGIAIRAEEDVRGFYIAVYDAVIMGIL